MAKMKDADEIETWLAGTVRAWILTDNPEMQTRLYAEAITLIWVLDVDATWAGARATFEEMRIQVDKELSWGYIPDRRSQPNDSN